MRQQLDESQEGACIYLLLAGFVWKELPRDRNDWKLHASHVRQLLKQDAASLRQDMKLRVRKCLLLPDSRWDCRRSEKICSPSLILTQV